MAFSSTIWGKNSEDSTVSNKIQYLKKFIFLSLAVGFSTQGWAGTVLKAHIHCDAYKDGWIDLKVSVSHDKLRLDFKGPEALGSVLYDRDSSFLVIADHLRKTFIPISSTDQMGLKLVAAITAGRMEKQMETSSEASKRAFQFIRDNARAFFNGNPQRIAKDLSTDGFPCDEYVTDIDGVKNREVWVTTPQKAGIDDEDYHTYRSLIHLMFDLSGDFLAQMGVDAEAFQQGLSEEDLPIQSNLYIHDRPSCHYKVISIRQQEIAQGTFDPPEDYKKLGLMNVMR